MADSEKPVPPVPNQQELVEKLTGSTKVSIPWMQWFVQLRDKVNTLNASIVNLAGITGTGFLAKSGASWVIRTITGTAGRINVTNGDGAAGNPTVDLVNTAVTPGNYTNTDLTVGADGRIIAASNGSGGAGAMTLIDTQTVTGAAATTISFTGIDLAASGRFQLEISLKNATGSTSTIFLYYNSDSTTTHYYRQVLLSDNTTLSAFRINDAALASMGANSEVVGQFSISPTVDGYPILIGQSNRSVSIATISRYDITNIWNDTANVTRIDLVASIASSFNIGSTAKLYRVG